MKHLIKFYINKMNGGLILTNRNQDPVLVKAISGKHPLWLILPTITGKAVYDADKSGVEWELPDNNTLTTRQVKNIIEAALSGLHRVHAVNSKELEIYAVSEYGEDSLVYLTAIHQMLSALFVSSQHWDWLTNGMSALPGQAEEYKRKPWTRWEASKA